MDAATAHLAHCRECWDLAAQAVAELKREGALRRFGDARDAFLTFLEKEEKQALSRLLAHSEWADLRKLAAEHQIERLKTEEALRTQEMFDTVLAAATAAALEDPHLGEETAHVAHTLAGCLPSSRFVEETKNDLQGRAMLGIANCRRLAADWTGASTASATARNHFEKGTGSGLQETALLSIEAALATDTGKLERALNLLSRASTPNRRAKRTADGAALMVQGANTLLAACRHEEAIARAKEALRMLTERDARLEMLARSIITESLAWLGRPAEACQSLLSTLPLYDQIGGERAELRLAYLEALLLAASDHAGEAEKAFRHAIAGFMEAELYKDAFLTMLTLFELLFRQGALDKAAQACQDAFEMMDSAGAACHDQVAQLWRDLLGLVTTRRLTERQVLTARHYLVRHWHAPAPRGARAGGSAVAAPRGGNATAGLGTAHLLARQAAEEAPANDSQPPAVARLVVGGLEEAVDSLDRHLVAEALAQCRGKARAATRLLGIARNTFKEKVKKYKLNPADYRTREDEDRTTPREDENKVLSLLRARRCWAEMRNLTGGQRLERLQSMPTLQTREMFDVMIRSASTAALESPERGRETALAAHDLAAFLPASCCSEAVRNDLRSDAMLVVATCGRLTADWEDSRGAIATARRHLTHGTGRRLYEARALSSEASLASDTGDFKTALSCLTRATCMYRWPQDAAALAALAVQEANTLLAAFLHEEAMARADEALKLLPPRETRLEILARSINTECLAFLRRGNEALRSLLSTWPLFEQLGGRRNQLRLGNLEALVLDALGYESQAEAAFRGCIEGYLEAELYKDAFLTMLTRFDTLYRRGALDKAARACDEAVELIEREGAGCHQAMRALWRDLRELVEAQRLTDQQLLTARHYVLRYWSSAAQAGDPSVATLPRWDANGTNAPANDQAEAAANAVAESEERRQLVVEPPPVVTRLAPGDYQSLIEGYERKVIAAALEQCGGRLAETARQLDIALNTLKVKMTKYGMRGAA